MVAPRTLNPTDHPFIIKMGGQALRKNPLRLTNSQEASGFTRGNQKLETEIEPRLGALA